MHTPLSASASTAGTLLSNATFEIPPFQREYSWLEDEVNEFWMDLANAAADEPYFLGLIILTEEEGRKHVVDGQQRILTLTLLAKAIQRQATHAGRNALAERIESNFLRSIDYETDDTKPRVILSDDRDNQTLQQILDTGEAPQAKTDEAHSLSRRMSSAYQYLDERLREDLSRDPFRRLGYWAEFLTNRLYFAVFVHPDPASAYRVFEVINTRGRELTTADLLKNYILSQTPSRERDAVYGRWQEIAKQFPVSGSNSFVQYIRHVVTVDAGHILPKDLFDFLAQRRRPSSRTPPSPHQLVDRLESYLPLYMQMIDPSLEGPAEPANLGTFLAFNSLGVMSVRPVLMAMAGKKDAAGGMEELLKLVVRRIVVGNLGTGNVERKIGEAARRVSESGDCYEALEELDELNPGVDEFREQLRKRSFNKSVLAFMRRSTIYKTITPDPHGVLHFIRPRQAPEWQGLNDDEISFWWSTIGNTVLADLERRPKTASTWEGFKEAIVPYALPAEWVQRIKEYDTWDVSAVAEMGEELAEVASDVWY